MGKIIDLTVPENITALLKNNEMSTDFRIMTDGMISTGAKDTTVHMIGSSTEMDLEGDRMSIKALHDMTKAPKNMSVWLNHEYKLPDDLFGSVLGTPKIVHQDGVADLHLDVDVELSNPVAARVKKYIDNGRKLGCSIGCMVTQFEVPDDVESGDLYQNPIIIHGVRVVEYSVVGIPANQRSWVENAIRGVFTRTLHPSLVPAMKSLWPRAYTDVVENRDLPEDTQQYFRNLPTRSSSGRRLDWYPEKKMFLFSHQGTERYMNREEVQEFVTKDISSTLNTAISTPMYQEVVKEPEIIQTACGSTSLPLDMESSWDKGSAHGRVLEWAGGKDNFSKAKMKEVHFRVEGDGSNITDYHLPFADIKNGKPTAIWHAIVAVAGALGGARGGLSKEGDEGAIRAKVAHYYRKAGKPIPWQDGDKSLDTIETNEHVHEEHAEHTHTIKGVAFAINKDGAPGVVIDANGNHEPVTGTHTHFHKMKAHANEDLIADGKEKGFIQNPLEVVRPVLSGDVPGDTGGGHTQIDMPLEVQNPIGGISTIPVMGQLHIHEHTHSGDNEHGHVHDMETVDAFKKPVPIQNADRDGDDDIDMDGVPEVPAGGARQLSLDEHQLSQLAAMNGFAKLLGLPEMTPDKVKEALYPTTPSYVAPPTPVAGPGVPDHVQKRMAAIHAHTYSMTGGKVCSGFGTDGEHLTRPGEAPDGSHPVPLHPAHAKHIQGIHDHAHALSGVNDNDADDVKRSLTLHLTKAAGDAEYGPGNAGGGIGPANLPEHVQKRIQAIHAHTYSMTGGKVCKAVGSDGSHLVSPAMAPDGSHPIPHHPDHAAKVQRIHDHIHALTNGMACGMGSQSQMGSTTHMNESNFQQARNTLMDAEGQIGYDTTQNPLKSLDKLVPTFERMSTALEGLDTKALKVEMEQLKKEFTVAKKGIQSIYDEAAQAAATIAALKNMPLGNPIHQSRTVQPTGTVSHKELTELSTTPGEETLASVLAQTIIETVKMPNHMSMTYRKWPNGVGGAVGKGVRPDLTMDQIVFMDFDAIEAYRAGFAADVPMIDDPME